MSAPQFDSQEEQDEYEELLKLLSEARAEAAIDKVENPSFDPADSDVAADQWQRALDKRCEH